MQNENIRALKRTNDQANGPSGLLETTLMLEGSRVMDDRGSDLVRVHTFVTSLFSLAKGVAWEKVATRETSI